MNELERILFSAAQELNPGREKLPVTAKHRCFNFS